MPQLNIYNIIFRYCKEQDSNPGATFEYQVIRMQNAKESFVLPVVDIPICQSISFR